MNLEDMVLSEISNLLLRDKNRMVVPGTEGRADRKLEFGRDRASVCESKVLVVLYSGVGYMPVEMVKVLKYLFYVCYPNLKMLQNPLIRFGIKHMGKTKGYRANSCILACLSELAPQTSLALTSLLNSQPLVFCHLPGAPFPIFL